MYIHRSSYLDSKETYGKIATCILNKIKLNKTMNGKGFRFKPPCASYFLLPCLYAVMKGLLVYQSKSLTTRKKKCFLCNHIKSVESYINILTSHDSLLVKMYLMGAILKETEILESKEVIANKEKSTNLVWWRFQKFYKRPTHQQYIIFENLLLSKAHPKWTTFIWQNCEPNKNMMTGKNNVSSKAMG